MLPRKPGQKPKDRAHDIESALDWMCNGMTSDDESTLKKFKKVGSFPPTTHQSLPQRQKDLDDILDWVRSGKADADDPTACRALPPSNGSRPI